MSSEHTLTDNVDLGACAREPIHIPGSIQPHGALIALDARSREIRYASANLDRFFDRDARSALGREVAWLIGAEGETLTREIFRPAAEGQVVEQGTIAIHSGGLRERLLPVSHRVGNLVVVEFEEVSEQVGLESTELYPLLPQFISRLQRTVSIDELGALAVREIRAITGFNRVLLYRFDADWNGTVIAEDGDGELPSYLDLRFPASDIPAQARRLYEMNRVRLIADAGYTPVPLLSLSQDPLDLSHSMLRSVSPVHVEYMRNMGTACSMSVSILVDGKLWGLISCHHRTPKHVPVNLRLLCDFLGQIVALQLGAHERRASYESRIRLQSLQSELLAAMAGEETFADALAGRPDALLKFQSAGGAAILYQGRCLLVGKTPSQDNVRVIADVLAGQNHELFATDSLSRVMPGAEAMKDSASGLLAIEISKLHRSYIIWFRPEVIQTVKWGGDPAKAVEKSGGARLHPRRSFELWKERVERSSLPWSSEELESAAEFRNAIVGVVLRKAEELAQLAEELEKSNKELEAFSYSVSHDLRAPFRHIVGYAELLRERVEAADPQSKRYADTIIESAQFAGTLVDNLLSFSQMGRQSLHHVRIDTNVLVREAIRALETEMAGRSIQWTIGDMPPIEADLTMMRLVFQNLISNSIKYTRTRQNTHIEIGGEKRSGDLVFFVRDNGVGFDMAYRDKLFGVFQRLHRMEEFEGTGIGLANVKRIVARHGGNVWAEGEPEKGATFHFSLPDLSSPDHLGKASAAKDGSAGTAAIG